MNKLLELGNKYAKESTWKDFALVKFCLLAMGVIIGTQVPKQHKKWVIGTSIAVFIATYIPLMAKVFKIVKEDIDEGYVIENE
ncbi:MAG: permease of phosphate ABC transporter [Eubacteriales bacterium]|nr:permease of phosphate ABC transporter [Eubacteriales bacterium]